MTMSLPAFDYREPETLDEAARMLDEIGPTAVVLAGGTDLVPSMKRRQITPGTVVSLAALDILRGIRIGDDGTVAVGAGTLLSELERSSVVPSALAVAAGAVASPQIRNVATVGGNLCLDTRCNYIDMPELWREASGPCLKEGGDVCWVAPRSDRCWAICSSDLAPAAIALDASVHLVSSRGERSIPVADLWTGDGSDHLTKDPGEILTELRIPPAPGRRATYHKLRRRQSIDFPLLGVAASLTIRESGAIGDVRIVFGAVAPAPLRATDAELLVEGGTLSPDSIDEAARVAARIVRPLDNTDLGSRYRKWMASVLVSRALHELAESS
ncbi:MAG: FAD binding domain-containing protein [Acidimicrobiia bacterium]|nr:FAD binding domain-containing protein [Acidimicrobiia bacterium]